VTPQPSRDPHVVLGVQPGATQKQVRDAYLARVRVIHPDRFDRASQPHEWNSANEMLKELNAAYDALTQPASSAIPAQPPPQGPQSTQAEPSDWGSDELGSGAGALHEFPKATQDRLVSRQAHRDSSQVQVPQATVWWPIGFVVVTAVLYFVLFIAAGSRTWNGDTRFLIAAIVVAAGVFLGWNVARILAWRQARLKPHFYITPLYFIKTDLDHVAFWPLWLLEDISITHNHRNGFYSESTVFLTINKQRHALPVDSKAAVEKLLQTLETFDRKLRAAFKNNDWAYIKAYDDFFGVRRSQLKQAVATTSRRPIAYAASVSLSLALVYGMMQHNDASAASRWYPHKEFVSMPGGGLDWLASGSASNQQHTHPPQPMPATGTVVQHGGGASVAPMKVFAAEGSNYLLKLVDPLSGDPVLTAFIRAASTVEIDVPLGRFELRYASGDSWYGYTYLFGPDTVYSKASTLLEFRASGDYVEGVSITLYRVPHGNLKTTRIRPAQF